MPSENGVGVLNALWAYYKPARLKLDVYVVPSTPQSRSPPPPPNLPLSLDIYTHLVGPGYTAVLVDTWKARVRPNTIPRRCFTDSILPMYVRCPLSG
jgi:hypothetical protein